MEPRTEAHLATAERNRHIASGLIGPGGAALAQPPPSEWAAVVAFYAAVHYVNAYLWERQRYEPRQHDDRERAVYRSLALRPAIGAYRRMRQLAFDARYVPLARLGRAAVDSAVQTHLAQVARSAEQRLVDGP